MMKHPEYMTVSLAKAYSSQGHIAKALEIYRHLLDNAPNDQTLKDAISALEKADPPDTGGLSQKGTDLTGLFESWMEWTLRYKKIMTLKRLKGQRR